MTKTKTESKKIYLDRIDRIFISTVNREDEITLSDLAKQHPALTLVPYGTLWYRAHSLAAQRLIRIERNRRALMCYPVER
jgi:hypothetical protein